MKNIYTQMVDSEKQKSRAFGISEKRFDWVNNYSNGNDLKNHKKILRKNKDNLEGGIGRYLNRIRKTKGKRKRKRRRRTGKRKKR